MEKVSLLPAKEACLRSQSLCWGTGGPGEVLGERAFCSKNEWLSSLALLHWPAGICQGCDANDFDTSTKKWTASIMRCCLVAQSRVMKENCFGSRCTKWEWAQWLSGWNTELNYWRLDCISLQPGKARNYFACRTFYASCHRPSLIRCRKDCCCPLGWPLI